MSNEVWRPVAGHPAYEVSDHGRVRSLDRFVKHECRDHTYVSLRKGKVLRPDCAPYPGVSLDKENRRIPVHVLVCEAFHGPRPTGYQVAHNDGNPKNSRADNLRWATVAENNADKHRHGTAQGGEANPRAKLTTADVVDIFSRLKSEPLIVIARSYGVDQSTIGAIKRGKRWPHLQHLRRA